MDESCGTILGGLGGNDMDGELFFRFNTNTTPLDHATEPRKYSIGVRQYKVLGFTSLYKNAVQLQLVQTTNTRFASHLRDVGVRFVELVQFRLRDSTTNAPRDFPANASIQECEGRFEDT